MDHQAEHQPNDAQCHSTSQSSLISPGAINLSDLPVVRISAADLDTMMSILEVQFVALSECLVSEGYVLELGGASAPGIHYNLSGSGRIYVGGEEAIELTPHTLIIVPANTPFRIEATGKGKGLDAPMKRIDGRVQTTTIGSVRRFIAGDGPAEIIQICGYFHATYGSSVDVFGSLSMPIVEQFSAEDRLDDRLKTAVAELVAQKAGTGTMTAALLKQVIVTLLRRSLSSTNLWVERFSMLRDMRIARAFVEMVSHPGQPHTILSLAKTACLSRSSFMERFASLVGKSPMHILRELRMRQAAQLLRASNYPMDQISRTVGYASTSSFLRAFRKAYGVEPSEHRAAARLAGASAVLLD
jgi:AraC-like DNA-binding protein